MPLVNNINNTQALALPQAWVENQHRAGLIHGERYVGGTAA